MQKIATAELFHLATFHKNTFHMTTFYMTTWDQGSQYSNWSTIQTWTQFRNAPEIVRMNVVLILFLHSQQSCGFQKFVFIVLDC
jgi:hypothetical protein